MRASTATSSTRAGSPCASRVRITHASKSLAGSYEASCGAITAAFAVSYTNRLKGSGRFLVIDFRCGVSTRFRNCHLGVAEGCADFINQELVHGTLVTA